MLVRVWATNALPVFHLGAHIAGRLVIFSNISPSANAGGRTDCFVQMKVPKDRIEKSPCRDIYVHKGPINIKDYQGRVYKVCESKISFLGRLGCFPANLVLR